MGITPELELAAAHAAPNQKRNRGGDDQQGDDLLPVHYSEDNCGRDERNRKFVESRRSAPGVRGTTTNSSALDFLDGRLCSLLPSVHAARNVCSHSPCHLRRVYDWESSLLRPLSRPAGGGAGGILSRRGNDVPAMARERYDFSRRRSAAALQRRRAIRRCFADRSVADRKS